MENQQKKVNSDDEREIDVQNEDGARADAATNDVTPPPVDLAEIPSEEPLVCVRLGSFKGMIRRDDSQPESRRRRNLQDEPPKKRTEDDDYLDSLNPRVLVTPTSADTTQQTVVLPDLKAIGEAIKKLTPQDILAMCTPSTGAIPKRIEKKADKKKPKQEQGSQAAANIQQISTTDTKITSPTNLDNNDALIQGICSAFENIRMQESNAKKDPVLDYLNGKTDKGVGPMIFNAKSLLPKDLPEEISSCISQLSKDIDQIPAKLKPKKPQITSPQTEPTKLPKEPVESDVGASTGQKKGTDEEAPKKKKKSKAPKCMGPMRVTVPATTYIQLRKRLDREPICKVIFGHVMINVYTLEELSNVQRYYDHYLNETIPRQFAAATTQQTDDPNTSEDQSEITDD